EEYCRQLQLLQWRGPERHWVLKCPFHGFGLDALLRLFPDACLIQTHRPMAQVLASACSLCAVMRSVYTDRVDGVQVGADMTEHLQEDILRPILEARAAHPGRVLDVQYRDLVRDPIATVFRIYDHAGRKVDAGMEGRMRRWLAENPANR